VTSRSPVVTAVRQVQMSQIFSNDDSQQSQTNIFPMKIWNILENSRIWGFRWVLPLHFMSTSDKQCQSDTKQQLSLGRQSWCVMSVWGLRQIMQSLEEQ
jgi:hypothetical protein